jgi:hypothetical protein
VNPPLAVAVEPPPVATPVTVTELPGVVNVSVTVTDVWATPDPFVVADLGEIDIPLGPLKDTLAPETGVTPASRSVPVTVVAVPATTCDFALDTVRVRAPEAANAGATLAMLTAGTDQAAPTIRVRRDGPDCSWERSDGEGSVEERVMSHPSRS